MNFPNRSHYVCGWILALREMRTLNHLNHGARLVKWFIRDHGVNQVIHTITVYVSKKQKQSFQWKHMTLEDSSLKSTFLKKTFIFFTISIKFLRLVSFEGIFWNNSAGVFLSECPKGGVCVCGCVLILLVSETSKCSGKPFGCLGELKIWTRVVNEPTGIDFTPTTFDKWLDVTKGTSITPWNQTWLAGNSPCFIGDTSIHSWLFFSTVTFGFSVVLRVFWWNRSAPKRNCSWRNVFWWSHV